MVVFSLTLVRHGETVANKDGIIQGHKDVALSDTGVAQARLVAFRLRNERFSHIFASDLSRASQTAQIIAEGSSVSQVRTIQQDPRLRERGFGVFEGKSFKELFAAAEKSNKKWIDFTPEGAETYREVRFRAKAFFRELCDKMASACSSGNMENAHTPHTPHTLLSASSMQKAQSGPGDTHLTVQQREQGSEGAFSTQAGSALAQMSTQPAVSTEAAVVAKKPRTDTPQLHRLSLEGGVGVEGGRCSDIDGGCAFSEGPGGGGTTTMARSNSSSSSGCSSLHDSVECPEGDMDIPSSAPLAENDGTSTLTHTQLHPSPTHTKPKPSPSAPVTIKGNCQRGKGWCSLVGGSLPGSSQLGGSPLGWLGEGLQSWVRDTDPLLISSSTDPAPPSGQTCPNVSLSPLLEHRLTSLSSVSSGRNSSFDEADIVPGVVGEVLVVSHGGLIKELLTHFMEDLQCKVPGGKAHALRICPNTGVSRFMVTLGHQDLPPTPTLTNIATPIPTVTPTVTCLLIHDKEHLKTLQNTTPLTNHIPAV